MFDLGSSAAVAVLGVAVLAVLVGYMRALTKR
jgi:hypothetical protein